VAVDRRGRSRGQVSRGLPDNPTSDPDVYLPFADRNQQIAIAVRADGELAQVAGAVRSAIRQADASIPVYAVSPLDVLIGERSAGSRFTTWLMSAFGAIALVLAALGIYGVMSYRVVQRTREIGIRVALGATTARVRALVIGDGAQLIVAGVAIGLPAAFGLTQLISTQLFEANVLHPAAMLPVVALFVASLLACYVPARRATRLDPLRALRHDELQHGGSERTRPTSTYNGPRDPATIGHDVRISNCASCRSVCSVRLQADQSIIKNQKSKFKNPTTYTQAECAT
jgi:hypothetical protein